MVRTEYKTSTVRAATIQHSKSFKLCVYDRSIQDSAAIFLQLHSILMKLNSSIKEIFTADGIDVENCNQLRVFKPVLDLASENYFIRIILFLAEVIERNCFARLDSFFLWINRLCDCDDVGPQKMRNFRTLQGKNLVLLLNYIIFMVNSSFIHTWMLILPRNLLKHKLGTCEARKAAKKTFNQMVSEWTLIYSILILSLTCF